MSEPGRLSPFTGLRHGIYIFLRVAHLLFTCAALPLAVYYLRSQKAAPEIPALLGWIAGLGAMLWAMLSALSQFAYPGTLPGAVAATAGIYATAMTGASLGGFNLAYGGYSAAFCSLVGQTLFLAGISVVSFVPRLKKKFVEGLPAWYGWFLFSCAVALGLLAWVFHRPVLLQLAAEPRAYKKALYLAAFASQILVEMRTLKQGSIIGDSAAKQGEGTWSLYESYVILIVLGFLGALTATWFVSEIPFGDVPAGD